MVVHPDQCPGGPHLVVHMDSPVHITKSSYYFFFLFEKRKVFLKFLQIINSKSKAHHISISISVLNMLSHYQFQRIDKNKPNPTVNLEAKSNLRHFLMGPGANSKDEDS